MNENNQKAFSVPETDEKNPHGARKNQTRFMEFSARVLFQGVTVLEILLGTIILIACICSSAGFIFTTDALRLLNEPAYLQDRISDICFIIIGVELIKMITSYTIDSVIDVILLAVARQVIVEHTVPMENLVAVLAIGLLFFIRKYLYVSHLDNRHDVNHRKGKNNHVGLFCQGGFR